MGTQLSNRLKAQSLGFNCYFSGGYSFKEYTSLFSSFNKIFLWRYLEFIHQNMPLDSGEMVLLN